MPFFKRLGKAEIRFIKPSRVVFSKTKAIEVRFWFVSPIFAVLN